VSDATLVTLLERAARTDRGVRFVGADETAERESYAELKGRASRAAAGLRDVGVRRGDRVAIVLSSVPEFCDAFFGCMLAGAIPAPLPPPVRLGRLDDYLEQTGALLRGMDTRLVLTDARTLRVLGRAVATSGPPLGCRTLGSLPAASASARPDARAEAGDTAFIQHSSGTTGLPRPIRLTHEAVVHNLAAIRQRILAAYPEDREAHSAAGWIPLYHDMGLVGCLLTSLAHPADLTLVPPEIFVRRPAIWLRTISRYGATVSAAPNFAYGLCADRIRDEEIEGVDLSCWKVALTGAEPVTPRAIAKFVDRFAPFGLKASALTPVYGLAEATLAVTFADPAAPCRQETFDADLLASEGRAVPAASGVTIVSVGRPLTGVELRIAGDASDGGGLEDGRLGRVLVRSPSLLQGYHGRPEESAAVLRGGWLDTGDTGFLLDGDLFLHGRGKDVIVVRGCKYAPQQLERALDDLEQARAGCAAAFGIVPQGSDSEEIVVLFERRRGADARDDESLVERARQRIVELSGLVPAVVRVLEPGTLPRTSSGKIRRLEARRLYLADGLRPPENVTVLTLLREMTRSAVGLARSRMGRGCADQHSA